MIEEILGTFYVTFTYFLYHIARKVLEKSVNSGKASKIFEMLTGAQTADNKRNRLGASLQTRGLLWNLWETRKKLGVSTQNLMILRNFRYFQY